MKAVAKHDCLVTLTTSLETISMNRTEVKKGQVIELPVYRDEKLSPQIADILGERCVTFKRDIWLMPTYSNDFDYVEN